MPLIGNTVVIVNSGDKTFLEKVNFYLERSGFLLTESSDVLATAIRVYARATCIHLWDTQGQTRTCKRCERKEVGVPVVVWQEELLSRKNVDKTLANVVTNGVKLLSDTNS